MDDQELQQLIEAKRTVEANRRRQAELQAMIADKAAAGNGRRLWPVWLGAAAASIALLLLTLPAIYNGGKATVEVAQVQPAEVPVQLALPIEEAEATPQEAIVPQRTLRTLGTLKTLKTLNDEGPEPQADTEQALPEPATVNEPAPSIDQPQAPVPATTQPHIHRRTGKLVTVDTKATSPQRERGTLGTLVAEALTQDSKEPLVIKTIELS